MALKHHTTLNAAFKYARQVTAVHAKSFYLSARFLPREKRWATYALYGFCRYADNLIDTPRDRSRSELLQEVEFLANELETAYRTGESEHPIMMPFILIARKYTIPITYPMELLEGVKMDLRLDRYETFEDLYLFCYRVAGVVGLMMTNLLGYKSDSAFEYAEKLGIAMQLTNILRDVQEDERMGRIYLPQEDLSQFNVSENQIVSEQMDQNMLDFMTFQVDRALRYYKEAEKGVELLDTNSQFAIYAASKIYRGILDKIIRQGYNPFLGRVYVPRQQKINILLREVLKTRVRMARETLIPQTVSRTAL